MDIVTMVFALASIIMAIDVIFVLRKRLLWNFLEGLYEHNKHTRYIGYAYLIMQISFLIGYIVITVTYMSSEKTHPEAGLVIGVILFGGAIFVYLCQILFYRVVDITEQKSQREIETLNMSLDAYINSMPGGVHRCEIGEDPHVAYVSEGFTKLTGYTLEDMQELFAGKYVDICYLENDRELFLECLQYVVENLSQRTVEYRVRRKDGEVIWISESMKAVKDATGLVHVFAVLQDVSAEVKEKERIRMANERFQFFMQQVEEVVFEIDVQTGEIDCSENLTERYLARGTHTWNIYDKATREAPIFHAEDMNKLKDAIWRCAKTGEKIERMIRLCTKDEKYHWCMFSCMGIRNDRQEVERMVGTITDIHEMYMEKEHFRKQAERDGLTRLYNKRTFEMLVRCYMADHPDRKIAMVMVDLDCFKQVNDQHGHQMGDEVIEKTAEFLRTALQEHECYIGRIGGDEFMAAVLDVAEEEELGTLVNSMYQGFQIPVATDESDAQEENVTGSIGAYCGSCAVDFEELYECVDKALYKEKERRKSA